MIKIEYLQNLLLISITLSSITCIFVQKTKKFFNDSKPLPLYSLIINLTFGVLFCLSFTDITFPDSLWTGLFSFLGADTIYKTLEGKILSYRDIVKRDNKSNLLKQNYKNNIEDR